MGVLDALRRERGKTDLYECRNCGTAVPEDVDECPACHCQEIAHYEL